MKIVILGAGISGLCAAWHLSKRYKDITLLEKQERVGGAMWTARESGFLFELGPRAFRPSGQGKATVELVKELGLEPELVAADEAASKRYLYSAGKLHLINFPFLLRHGLIQGVLHDLFTPSSTLDDETIYNFFTRRFNKKLTESLIDPFVKGIFAGDCRTLSMRSCFPALWRQDHEKGSIVRGLFSKKRERLPSLYTFRQGMETLPLTLAQKLGDKIMLGQTVLSLDEIDADRIIAAIPTSAMAKLIGVDDPSIYAKIAVVNFGWNTRVLNKRGFGFLVPSSERTAILGMSWDSEIFPALGGADETRITVMLEGTKAEKELFVLAQAALRDYLGIQKEPAAAHLHVVQLPQYRLNHHQHLAAFKEKLPSCLLPLGNCYEGLSVNDCIVNARRLCDTI